MKLILLSDIHLTEKNFVCRKDNIFETQFNKLEYVFNWAKVNNAKIIVAGDLFDKPRGYKILTMWFKSPVLANTAFFGIWGQHDMYFRKKSIETNLGILEHLNNIQVLNNKSVVLNNMDIYGCSFGDEIPIPTNSDRIKILVIHAPIYDTEIQGLINGNQAKSFLNKHTEYDLILCGDIHQKFIYKQDERIICNTGCILRKSVDIADHKPCFFVYDSDNKKLEEIEIPYAKKEDVISNKHLEQKNYISESLNSFINQIQCSNRKESIFKDNLNNFIVENKIDNDIIFILNKVMEGGSL